MVARGRAVFDALRRPEGEDEPSSDSDEAPVASGGEGSDPESAPPADPHETFPGEQAVEPASEAFPGEHPSPVEPAEVPADALLPDDDASLPPPPPEGGSPEPIPGPRPIQGGEAARSLAGPGRAVGAHRDFPRILAIANQKGGVGKTTTAVNLGASLAERGHRVLVVDLDPQGNATTGLGINARTLERSIYDVLLHDVPIDDCIEPTSLRNLFAVPATIELAGAEIELVPTFSRELKLRKAL